MSKSPLPWIAPLTLCMLQACGVSPGRTEARVLAAAPQNREARQSKEQQRKAQEKARQEEERRAREERRRQDRERRERAMGQDRARRDDPDWPQGRRERSRDRDPRDRDPRDRDRDDRDSRYRRAYALLSWAGGDYDFKDGRGVEDNSAEVFRFRTGATDRDGSGGGVDLKLYDAKHDAYDGTVGSTGLDQLDVYLFFTKRVGDGRFHIPIRFGPYYSLISAKQNATGDYTFYNNVGLRLEVEPTLNLIQTRDVTLQAYTTLSAGGHLSYIDDEITRENYSSEGASVGVEPGVRLKVRNMILGASYHLNETAVRQSNRETGRDGIARKLPRVETEFKGFMFTVGFRF